MKIIRIEDKKQLLYTDYADRIATHLANINKGRKYYKKDGGKCEAVGICTFYAEVYRKRNFWFDEQVADILHQLNLLGPGITVINYDEREIPEDELKKILDSESK